MNDQDDLSDQSEGESFSFSAPSGEPLSREPSEPLFDADFQVKQVLKMLILPCCHPPSPSFFASCPPSSPDPPSCSPGTSRQRHG